MEPESVQWQLGDGAAEARSCRYMSSTNQSVSAVSHDISTHIFKHQITNLKNEPYQKEEHLDKHQWDKKWQKPFFWKNGFDMFAMAYID